MFYLKRAHRMFFTPLNYRLMTKASEQMMEGWQVWLGMGETIFYRTLEMQQIMLNAGTQPPTARQAKEMTGMVWEKFAAMGESMTALGGLAMSNMVNAGTMCKPYAGGSLWRHQQRQAEDSLKQFLHAKATLEKPYHSRVLANAKRLRKR
jgi:hypothetical protein